MTDHERVRWARALSFAGWLFLVAYLCVLVALIRRASALQQSSFEDGLWWQRVEQVSFASLPQNLIVLVPAAAAAIAGTVLNRSVVDQSVIWLAQLVRVIAGLAYVIIGVALLGIVGIFFRNPDSLGDVDALLSRLGGVLMSVAMIRLCLEAERSG